MTTLITTISMLAAVIGITGIVPQLVTMLRTRSSGGQSTLGWSLGLTANLALAFVNACGYHAAVLATGNLLSFTGCAMAVHLVRRYREGDDQTVVPAVTDMHTGEFVALRDAVLAEHHRRTGDYQLAV
jgi:PQ loop repeat